MPSFIFIQPIIWPQYANVTDRQTDRTDNGPIAQNEPFYKWSPKNRLDLSSLPTLLDNHAPVNTKLTRQPSILIQPLVYFFHLCF